MMKAFVNECGRRVKRGVKFTFPTTERWGPFASGGQVWSPSHFLGQGKMLSLKLPVGF